MIWNHRIIDAIFRGAKKHSYYGNAVIAMITKVVTCIRTSYRPDVTIVIRLDSGFYSEKNMKDINDLNVGFIMTGKMYDGVKTYATNVDHSQWATYDNGHQTWCYVEFGYRGGSWNSFWRSFYTSPLYNNKQMLLFADWWSILRQKLSKPPVECS